MMSFKVYGYKQGSASAKALAEALEGKVLKHVGSKFRPKRGDVVVNWGASDVPDFGPATTLNSDVKKAQCKLATFKQLKGIANIPLFTESKDEAAGFQFPVVCRTKLRGHSGDGIVIANNKDELVDAPLYTQYLKKKDEYRVHVMKYNAFFIQHKARKLGVENPDWQVRNLKGGFVFVEAEAVEVPNDVLFQATQAIQALDLDFGGVDVIWNEREKKAYVLEVNTACGLEERTAERYRDQIRGVVQDIRP